MKFSQLIEYRREYNVKNVFFLFFQKTLNNVKASVRHLRLSMWVRKIHYFMLN